ncbi:MAG TPA: hypothetical protein VKU39_14065 [Streptosporangiaceae bacterium]|nr:hypothetical protein [Streptosporangiaceae bacterium]
MTAAAAHETCYKHPRCNRTPSFQACLTAADGPVRVNFDANLCATHLGDVVQMLARKAREHGFVDGHVTVSIIDPPPPVPRLPSPHLWHRSQVGFAFASIALTG